MTREEAAAKIPEYLDGHCGSAKASVPFRWYLLNALEDLGVIKFDTIDDATFNAAVERLQNCHIMAEPVVPDRQIGPCKLLREGAGEIIDILRKSGFKITKD